MNDKLKAWISYLFSKNKNQTFSQNKTGLKYGCIKLQAGK